MTESEKIKSLADIAKKAAENVKFAWVTAEASLKEAVNAANIIASGNAQNIQALLDNSEMDAEAISANVEAIALSTDALASAIENLAENSDENSIPAAIKDFVSMACEAAEMAAKASDNIALAIQSILKNR